VIDQTATHLASASVVVNIDDLTISDLLTLVDIKRARERTAEDELYVTLLSMLDGMPRSLADVIAQELDVFHLAVVLERHFPQILLARYGSASVAAWGYSASVAS
jgi:hypothetical protein